MLAFNLGVMPAEFWHLTLWELHALLAARIDQSAETVRPLDSLFDDLDALTSE